MSRNSISTSKTSSTNLHIATYNIACASYENEQPDFDSRSSSNS